MSWVLALKNFTSDYIRQIQYFMVCRQLGIILSSIVLAWFLPVEDVGTIELLMFVGYLITFFWSDALLRGYLSNKVLQGDPQSATSFFLLYFLGNVIVVSILLFGQHWLIPVFTSRPDIEGLEIFALYQVLIIPLWIAPFLGLLKGQNILLASVYVLIGPAFSCWTGYTSLPGIAGILLGLFSYALVGFSWVLTKTSLVKNHQMQKIIRAVWPVTWPLILYSISIGLARSFDAWLVARHFDDASFAIFRYGAREFPLVVALAAGLGAVMIPRLYQQDSLPELKTRSTRLMHTCYPLIIVLIFLSPPLFAFIFGPVYRESASIFKVYLLITLTQLFFPQSIMTARGDTKLLWYISVAELIVNVIASVILMRYYGLIGIAWGTLIAFTFEKLVLLIIINARYEIKPQTIMNVKTLIFYAIALVSSYILSIWVFGI